MHSASSDVLVIGAGLAGLAVAMLLHQAGKGVQVLEAGPRIGGRIRSVVDDGDGAYLGDLGPTWIWTPYQPVARRWIDQLGLDMFEQFALGPGLYEAGSGAAPVAVQMPVQYGSERVVGGSQALVERIAARLPASAVRLSSPVSALGLGHDGVEITVASDAPQLLRAKRVVVAMPLRLAATKLDWRTPLVPELRQALEETPTWMASHAKAVVLYESAFWRERGFSGRLASQVGPLVEAHDHCGPDGAPAALFGFVGWPHEVRARLGAPALVDAIDAQLVRCFGAGAPRPLAIHVHDWSTSRHIAAPLDLSEPMPHPSVGAEVLRAPHLDGRLWFATSETAARSPGLIEGALDAAQRTAADILATG